MYRRTISHTPQHSANQGRDCFGWTRPPTAQTADSGRFDCRVVGRWRVQLFVCVSTRRASLVRPAGLVCGTQPPQRIPRPIVRHSTASADPSSHRAAHRHNRHSCTRPPTASTALEDSIVKSFRP
ncbi:unnamed protein product [Nesidiocoris tenuis]|uniref:Uncharacterized protein n=1 Tax=Nesidiocoris tenuis TaxID=355587 RepID=A0A6H5GSD5_9HEMI|nr:unnamed protein product [Nesidiocoris tenuis]